MFSVASGHHYVVYIIAMCTFQKNKYLVSGWANTSPCLLTNSPFEVQNGFRIPPHPPVPMSLVDLGHHGTWVRSLFLLIPNF